MTRLALRKSLRRCALHCCALGLALAGGSLCHVTGAAAQGAPATPPGSGAPATIAPAPAPAPQLRLAPLGTPAAPAPASAAPFPPPSGQSAPAPVLQQAEPVAPKPKPDGFFDALGRWFDKSSSDFKASVEENNARWRAMSEKSQKAARDAAAASQEAAEAFRNLSNLRMVEGRHVCELAANGSPDCQAAAEQLCKGKGFTTGKSADIQSSQKCSARALLDRDPGGCRTETVVVKAACQ
jgi:hypothetical protein